MIHSDNKKGRAVVYTRFSPRRDAQECQSCAWQLAECEQYAAKNHLRVGATFSDPDISGADAVRPTLWAAIDELHRGDTLLVWKWDRLARDLLLQLQIERAVQQKGATITATVGDMPGDNPQATFMRQILGAVAELERKMISQRTSVAMKAMQRDGRRMSYLIPYGWKADPNDQKRLIEDEREQAIRRDIISRANAGESYRSIARSLANRGIKSRCGKLISDKLVKNIVVRG